MKSSRLKNAAVLGIALVLGSLGIYNIVLKATWTLMDDGVFWKQGPQGLYAARVAAGGPGDKAGVRPGDTVLAVDGEEALSPAPPPSTPSDVADTGTGTVTGTGSGGCAWRQPVR